MKKSIAFLCLIFLLFGTPFFSLSSITTKQNPVIALHIPGNCAFASDEQKNVTSSPADNSDEENILMRVMYVILIIWAGLALYLFRIDRKIVKLEKVLNEE